MSEDIAALKEQIATLQAKVAALEERGGRRVIPPPPEPATRVFQPVATAAADLPDGKELQALRAICAREHPSWCDSDAYVFGRRGTVTKEENDREWLFQFERAILALSNMKALPKPDTKRTAGFHVDTALDILRSVGKHTSELRTAPFCMACFVMGVPVSGLGIATCSVSLGLSEYVGKPVEPGAWRAVLKAGRLPSQHRVERIIEQPSPVKFYGAGY
jgi:hypothetical protein